ncbi:PLASMODESMATA CALLOSE-BINDING PROTEIN 3-like isoform X2 [Phalaenopsis equestris]|uniref:PLASMODESMATA CALLOSE-BINDING PROTEIN 3-like isoform X2 n=1 Tax=Phalaenopsis equestris TaxID=78828 RepID=UPI0009E642BB|nr:PLASMODESMATA CALLOSE-BINDING PROTEIN 3-like isoform X2 [Phalaenopsis equestris]
MSSHRAIPSLFAFPSLSTLLLSMDCHSTSPSAAAAIFFLFAATIARAGEAAQWCIARSDASSTALQTALDYACGPGMADCLPIQPNGLCYLPNSLPAHASYAFNSFYQRSGSCDFAGVATVSITDPSLLWILYIPFLHKNCWRLHNSQQQHPLHELADRSRIWRYRQRWRRRWAHPRSGHSSV